MALYNQFFFHDMIRKYIIAFGSIFDNIQVARFNDDCTENSRERVPLLYSPKEKFVVRTEEDPDLQARVAIKLPRMGYELIDFNYAPTRKLQTTQYTQAAGGTGNSNKKSYTPVPYDFNFSLYIMTKTQVDGFMIVEQILPFFTPDYPLTVNVLPEMCQVQTPLVTLNTISKEDDYEGSFNERRKIIWTLNFTLQGYFFAPVFELPVIKQTFSNMGTLGNPISIENVSEIFEGIPVVPGKTLDQILASDPWKFQTTITPTP